jgi:phosphoglycolate phosphatase
MTALFTGHAAPRIGFDLDLTLVDTRRATAFALESVNASLGTAIDVAEFVRRLGPPVRTELRRWIAEELLDEAADQFRSALVGEGLQFLQPLPGATAALAEMAARGGTSIVVTSRRQHIAEAVLAACDLRVDVVVGGLTGTDKAPAIRGNAAACYVGDHPLDMAGATAAGVPGIGVLTGSHSGQDLRNAGATLVLASLLDFNWVFEAPVG